MFTTTFGDYLYGWIKIYNLAICIYLSHLFFFLPYLGLFEHFFYNSIFISSIDFLYLF